MSDKYTFADVIIDPCDPRLEGAIGKLAFWEDSPILCLKRANSDAGPFILNGIVEDDVLRPFKFHNKAESCCVILSKEPSYKERQEKWIAENDIKIGDKFLVIRSCSNFEDGWSCVWEARMNDMVGNEYTVSEINPLYGLYLEGYYLPFFALKKVVPKYKPFDLTNEKHRLILAEKGWVKSKATDVMYHIECILDSRIDISLIPRMSAESLFDHYVFLDGTPCGVLEE